MYKYLNLALIFGVSLFVNAAHAANMVDLPTPRTPGITINTDSSDNIASFSMPQTDGSAITYYVHYSLPSGWTSTSTRVTSNNQSEKYFRNISTSNGKGGAIAYTSTSTRTVTAGFINNEIKKSIFNNDTMGGAIYTTSNNLTLTGDFIGNKATSSEYNVLGGAIYNSGTITTLNGLFINNTATGTSSSSYDKSGGAIYNAGTITSITGDFINNTAPGGGAIYNAGGSIGSIRGNFIGNSSGISLYQGGVSSGGSVGPITGNFINNGGAISVKNGSVSLLADTQDIIFYNNGTDISVNAYGGTNHSYVYLNAASDHFMSFGGNIVGSASSGTGSPHMYINNDSTYKGGRYIFNNTVSGNSFNLYNGAYVKLGSIVQPNNTTTYGTLSTTAFTTDSTSATLDSQNAHIDSHSLGSTTLGSNLNYMIDMQHSNTTADKLTYTKNGGSGSVIVTAINEIGSRPTATGTYNYQVLNGTGITLAVDQTLANSWSGESTVVTDWVRDAIGETTTWATAILERRTSTTSTTSLTASGQNLVYTVASSSSEETRSAGDTLALVNQASNPSSRTFSASVAGTYTAGATPGTTSGTMKVKGLGKSSSNLNLNGNAGFTVSQAGSSLTLEDVSVSGASGHTANVTAGTLNVVNSDVSGAAITGSGTGAVNFSSSSGTTNTINAPVTSTGSGGINVTSGTTDFNSTVNGINISSGATASADPDNLTNNVTNNGTFVLDEDGTLSYNISGSGTTQIGAGIILAATASTPTLKFGSSGTAIYGIVDTISSSGTGNSSNYMASTKAVYAYAQPKLVSGTNIKTINGSSILGSGDITITDTNTHYTTGLYVGASGAKSNAATTNGNTYLKLYDDSTSRASFKISGSGATSVT
ncbi:MAG: hypothetical protein IJS26_03630, partial [Alphaproteobacteria bacterium]|nr:hypothetical protein [Alphaproteobacteria bacterium]